MGAWLRERGLDSLSVSFEQHGLTSLDLIAELRDADMVCVCVCVCVCVFVWASMCAPPLFLRVSLQVSIHVHRWVCCHPSFLIRQRRQFSAAPCGHSRHSRTRPQTSACGHITHTCRTWYMYVYACMYVYMYTHIDLRTYLSIHRRRREASMLALHSFPGSTAAPQKQVSYTHTRTDNNDTTTHATHTQTHTYKYKALPAKTTRSRHSGPLRTAIRAFAQEPPWETARGYQGPGLCPIYIYIYIYI